MQNILVILQIIVSVILTLSVLLQSRGTGMSASFGGSGESYRSRRGMDSVLYKITIIFASLFLILSIANVLIQ